MATVAPHEKQAFSGPKAAPFVLQAAEDALGASRTAWPLVHREIAKLELISSKLHVAEEVRDRKDRQALSH